MRGLLILFILTACGENVEVLYTQPILDAAPCIAQARSDGNYVRCSDGSEFKVENGADGLIGTFNGQLELIELCPQISALYPETLLYLNGQYLAFLSNADFKRQRLTLLIENTLYSTTDGRNIQFTISNGEVMYISGGCD